MKNKDYNVVLVPVDFTEASDCATNHAINIAKTGKHELVLVHVLDTVSKEKLKKEGKTEADLEKKLEMICEGIKDIEGLKASYQLAEGTIFKDIEETGKKWGSKWQVMGTHGVIGLEQKILGSFAIKVITSAHCPTIVTQKKKINTEGYKRIVFPVHQYTESKHKLWPTIEMAKQYGAEVLLYMKTETDEYLQNHVNRNTQHAERYLEANGIEYSVSAYDPTEGHFTDHLIAFAEANEADLIVILTTAGKNVTEFIIGKDEEKIINNAAQIPVMCVNPVSHIYSITEPTVY